MQNSIKYLIENELTSNRKHSRTNFLQKRFDYSSNLYSKDLKAHFSCVNAIEFSNGQSDYLVSGKFGKKIFFLILWKVHLNQKKGGDDKRVLIWSVNNDLLGKKANPISMKALHNSNIFTLSWNNENTKVFSGGNDHNVFIHDVKT